jgi:hypothetical protein
MVTTFFRGIGATALGLDLEALAADVQEANARKAGAGR